MIMLKDFLIIKKREVISVSPNTTLYETLMIMSEKDIGAVPVTEKGKLVGIFSERDFARNAALLRQLSMKLPVGQFMTQNVRFVNPGNTIEECMNIMTNCCIRHLPILEDDKIVGIITIGDVVKHLLQEQKFILRKVLDSIEEGKNTLRMTITFNIEENVIPLVKDLAKKHPEDSFIFRLLEEHLNEISSEYYRRLFSKEYNFTPSEISIVKLIKANYREKQISEILNISISTVKKHKYAIRRKLGLIKKPGNLLTHLDRIA
jgi:CBS domain-containing protein